VVFEELELWVDPVARAGPEAMAVDEWLLETRALPLLRVYDWAGEWGSVGYFGKIEEARERLPGLDWVRRWTGGGVVDHRCDLTYSLIVPKGHPVAEMRGGESYRRIHELLISAVREEGMIPALSERREKAGALCFENPVEFDVVGAAGEKLAGAAQRRGRAGLLHQGSVAVRFRGDVFADRLAAGWAEVEISTDEERVGRLVAEKYGKREWLERC
jgi:lipoyl(octanoyl) transferase